MNPSRATQGWNDSVQVAKVRAEFTDSAVKRVFEDEPLVVVQKATVPVN